MLLGAPGVKPDRMIQRFLRHATGHRFSNAAAEEAVGTVAALAGSLDVAYPIPGTDLSARWPCRS